MNRNVFDKIINWDKEYTGKALILTGAPGTGKTYLSQELAKNFHDSYLYLNPRNDYKLKCALFELSAQEKPDFSGFLHDYYQIPYEWLSEFLIILDDFDWFPELHILLECISINTYLFRLLILSTTKPNKHLSEQCHICEITPLEFDEYLRAIGSEWYTEIIQAHYQTKKKIPEIVHKEMLNLFRDYLRVGGMPSAINEYIHTESTNSLFSVHRNLNEAFLSQFRRYNESSSIRLNQIMEHIPDQLIKSNKNYRYNMIRKGATHNMYRTEIQYLSDLHLINKIERADFELNDNKILITTHDNQFRLFPIDSGILYSQIMSSSSEYADGAEEEDIGNSSANSLYQLLAETYLLFTLKTRSYKTMFWESGSQAKIDCITLFDNSIMPIEIKYLENKRSKSMHVFKHKFPILKTMKFGLNNFSVDEQTINCPIYSLFCL